MARIVLGAVIIATMAVSARAQYVNGDLIIGFDGGSSDFIYDLGQYSSLTQGETWNLGATLGTQFGIVGGQSTGSHIYATSSDSAENGFDPTGLTRSTGSVYANVRTIAGNLTTGTSRTTTPTDTTGWTMQTDQAAGTPGNYFFNNFFNPNVPIGQTAYLFDNMNTGSVVPTSFFNYDSSSGVLTFGTPISVPEPSTLGIFTTAGLLLLVVRRQIARKS